MKIKEFILKKINYTSIFFYIIAGLIFFRLFFFHNSSCWFSKLNQAGSIFFHCFYKIDFISYVDDESSTQLFVFLETARQCTGCFVEQYIISSLVVCHLRWSKSRGSDFLGKNSFPTIFYLKIIKEKHPETLINPFMPLN